MKILDKGQALLDWYMGSIVDRFLGWIFGWNEWLVFAIWPLWVTIYLGGMCLLAVPMLIALALSPLVVLIVLAALLL